VSATQSVLIALGAVGFAALGSFVCVIIDRLPVALDEPNEYGELWDTRPWSEVLGGHSRCSDCGVPVRPIDNVPVVSWLLLRGRCRGCNARIPAYHPVVELLCPALFLLVGWAMEWQLIVLPVLWLVPVGVAVAVIDLRTLMVPTRLVWPAFLVAVVLSVTVAGVEGEWTLLLTALAGLAGFAGPLFLLWFVLPKAMGFGDVRLATLLGWTLGFCAGTRPVAGLILAVTCLALSSMIGLLVGVVALGARGRKAQVPFGPALFTGALLCCALAEPILEPFGVFAT
jgi:leader peptidase (prepilin peptidase)/N-methyltransferase